MASARATRRWPEPVYGLYDGGKLVATATTDEQGQFDFGGPYVAGDLWYVQEISASEGYLLNPARYEVKACAAEQGAGAETVFHVEFKDAAAGKTGLPERVKKQSLSFYKVTGTDRNDRLDPLTGATFSVYLVSELAKGRYAELEDAQVVQAVIDDYRDPTALDYGAMKEIPAVGGADQRQAGRGYDAEASLGPLCGGGDRSPGG